MAALTDVIKKVLILNTSVEEFLWLENSINGGRNDESALQIAFMVVPKFIKKNRIRLHPEIKKQLSLTMDFVPDNWTSQQLARVFIVLQFDHRDELKYKNRINTLFETAEVNELIALYSSLPFLYYPDTWQLKAIEAVRSNIGSVFDAIAFNNPFPAKYFNEAAWNQLVLKTIFNEKDIKQIVGLKQRSNKELAYMIIDFAAERLAAGRPISSNVWTLVAPFLEDELIGRLEKLFQSGKDIQDPQLTKHLGLEPAKELLKKYNFAINV